MESEEFLLKPCKPLPPALQNRISPHLGSVSSTQGEMAQAVDGSAKDVEGNCITQEDGVVAQADKMSRLYKGKEKESATTARKHGPLKLLDLPLDILKDIFKEVSVCRGDT